MPQCHDNYPELQSYHASVKVDMPEGAQCHDATEISVLIAGSDGPTRARIREMLAADERVGAISEASVCDDALRRSDEVDVVVVGLRSESGLGALGAINELSRRSTRPAIVALSPVGEAWLDRAAMTEGADQVVDWPDDEMLLVDKVIEAVQPAYF